MKKYLCYFKLECSKTVEANSKEEAEQLIESYAGRLGIMDGFDVIDATVDEEPDELDEHGDVK